MIEDLNTLKMQISFHYVSIIDYLNLVLKEMNKVDSLLAGFRKQTNMNQEEILWFSEEMENMRKTVKDMIEKMKEIYWRNRTGGY